MTVTYEVLSSIAIIFILNVLYMTISVHTDVQIKQLNVPIKVKISEWNAGGLLSRIEVRITHTSSMDYITVHFQIL